MCWMLFVGLVIALGCTAYEGWMGPKKVGSDNECQILEEKLIIYKYIFAFLLNL